MESHVCSRFIQVAPERIIIDFFLLWANTNKSPENVIFVLVGQLYEAQMERTLNISTTARFTANLFMA